MEILEDVARIDSLDSEGMLKVEEEFYRQLLEAKRIAKEADLSVLKGNIYKGIAFLGMGGSGYAGGMAKSIIEDKTGMPVIVVKGYNLPGSVGKGWLVVVLSYSGNTEETISAAKQAIERGCFLLFVCSGGKLEEIAFSSNYTLIKIPSGLQPRGATGYLFFPTLIALKELGVVDIPARDIDEALEAVRLGAEEYNRSVPSGNNAAKSLALKIAERLPIIYGTEGYLSTIAYRLKCEINENSKTPCWCNEFPELNHNETVGWQRLTNITGNFILIVFREADEDKRIETRIDVTLELIRKNVAGIVEIPVKGKSKLARALSAMYLGDMASVYLALLAGVDPGPVEKIKYLKDQLAKLDS